jgi:hypothetical protein
VTGPAQSLHDQQDRAGEVQEANAVDLRHHLLIMCE